MAEKTSARHVLTIESCDKPMRIPSAISSELKGSVSAKMISRMKKEVVPCPVHNEKVCFLQCFVCNNFLHRIKGTVGCKGET